MEYISKQSLLADLNEATPRSYFAFETMVREYPTEDVAPVIHAYWRPSKEPKHEKEFSRFFVCTNCSHDIQLRYAGIVEDIGFEYCPHCGAKMDEEVNNG